MKKLLLFGCFIASLFNWFSVNGQTSNLIPDGNMENGTWSGVPGKTNLVLSFEAGSGLNGSTALKLVTSNMGGDPYYILRCDDLCRLTNGSKVTISFWAKSSVADMRLQPWVQESDGNQWMNFGDAYLTTSWVKYQFTVTLTTQTSNNYKVKFRGYNLGTIYLDDVQIGPVDYENVAQSGIYDVTISQNGMTQPLNVFRNSCPAYSLGYQNMDSKDQHPLDLFAGRTINWTKFSFQNPITVHVKVTDTQKVPVSGQTVRILPSRYGITSSTSGNVVTFTITEPGQYSVEIGTDGYKNGLMIFADPVETDIPSQSDPNYLVLDKATASSVASIPTSYSGVYFKRGVHDIGIFNVPSHIKNIYFQDGSWVYGALSIIGNPNVRIYGRGVLSSANFNYREANCINAEQGSNYVTLEGLVVADPKYYGIRLVGTNNKVSYTKIIGGWVYNCDGISVFKKSTVSKCFIWANDDNIKAYRDSLTWSDIVCWQLNNGGIIQTSWGGAAGGSTSKGVKISRVDVLHAEWDVDRFNVGLLGCIGNHYKDDMTKSDLLQDWLIEDVVTENDIPLVFNITPEPNSSHVHIHGMTLKNWNVHQNESLGFVNEIKGEDPNDYFSGFVFDNVKYNDGVLKDINYITSGEMDNGNWVAVPKTTDQVVSLANGFGTGDGFGLRSVVTTMGGGSDYVIKCNETFPMTKDEKVTISFWAKATADGKRLVPFVQETVNNTWMNMGDVTLTTNYQRYACTTVMSLNSSNTFQLKFRGYETAWIFLDKVQIGPPDWRTRTGMETLYLNTPTFLPNTKSARIPNFENTSTNINFFPNPVNDILYITGGNNFTKYQIFDLTGVLKFSGFGSQVNVSSLVSGLYVLIINDVHKFKFIKN